MRETMKPARACDCPRECTSGSRNRYFTGKRLTPDSFSKEQAYQLERRRLLNRAMHGWGVVYGLGVQTVNLKCCEGETRGLEVGVGLALDRAGRELFVAETRTVRPSEVMRLAQKLPAPVPPPGPPAPAEPEKPVAPAADRGEIAAAAGDPVLADRERPAPVVPGPIGEKGEKVGPRQCWLLCAHYAERGIDPVTVKDECHCERHVFDRVCEDVFFTVQPVSCQTCIALQDCELCCECDPAAPTAPAARPHDRGPHACLCDYLTHHVRIGAQVEELDCVAPGLAVDLNNGVPLACVTLVPDSCGGWMFEGVLEACGPRRLVKRNDLLYDLIRGCDLTVIDRISWEGWHRSTAVKVAEFAARFSKSDAPPPECVTDFTFHFSRPVQLKSLAAPGVVSMTVVGPLEATGWGETLHVPVLRLEPREIAGACAQGASLVVDGDWVAAAIAAVRKSLKGSNPWSVFRYDRSTVEIEIRGDYLIDCNGQAVDANPVGTRATPSGNGTPGGTYLSTFVVMAEEPAK